MWINGTIATTETTNYIIIQGLPFNATGVNLAYGALSIWNFTGFGTYKDEIIARSQPGANEIVLQRYGANLTFNDLTKAGINFMVSGHYKAA